MIKKKKKRRLFPYNIILELEVIIDGIKNKKYDLIIKIIFNY